MDIQAL